MALTDYDALTFDCYGTLIDWETGITEALRPLTSRLAAPLSQDEVLAAHAVHESTQQLATPTMPYRRLLAVVYRRLSEEWRLPVSQAECEHYGASIGDWPAFPDSPEALAYLKRHYRLVILSNVDDTSFAASNERLGVSFDAICTAEAIGSYKPSLRNFDYLLAHLDRIGIRRNRILHTAQSLFHDHVPAKELGLATCWIDRRRDKPGFGATMDPGPLPETDYRFGSMAELAEAHRTALASA
ncbi:haloacid dehalogenase type II [uncultured Enterovirga sp.]|uniref:haloacid dehalogenase type II n=1 Tax=uncultured Enterovirga sp. TaxID=2026352 RepID=UPI0035CA9750